MISGFKGEAIPIIDLLPDTIGAYIVNFKHFFGINATVVPILVYCMELPDYLFEIKFCKILSISPAGSIQQKSCNLEECHLSCVLRMPSIKEAENLLRFIIDSVLEGEISLMPYDNIPFFVNRWGELLVSFVRSNER